MPNVQSNCGLADGVMIHFRKSGIKLRPYDMTCKVERKRFSHADVVLSHQAGQLVQEKHEEAEPVDVYINGQLQDRYYYQDQFIDVSRDRIHVTLLDALKILERGTITQTFENTNLGDIINYIIDHRDDPSGVITGVRHPGGGVAAQSEQVADANVAGAAGPLGGSVNDGEGLIADDGNNGAILNAVNSAAQLVQGFNNAVGEAIQGYTTFEKIPDGGIELKGASPWEAMKKVAETFKVQPWVNKGGVFTYDIPENYNASAINIVPNEGGARLNEYSVTEPAQNVGSVRVYGNIQQKEVEIIEGATMDPISGLRYVGEAWIPGQRASGYSLKPEKPLNVSNQDGIQTAARNLIMNTYMEQNSGNVVINSKASENNKAIAALEPGDAVGIAGAGDDCRRPIQAGLYAAKNITHTLNQSVGWETTIEVGQFPPNPQAKSYILHVPSGTRYEDLEDYKDQNPLDPQTNPSYPILGDTDYEFDPIPDGNWLPEGDWF